ncbi:MAG: hypothetical protein ACLGG0_14345 [Bacteriovoracia bacterium]
MLTTLKLELRVVRIKEIVLWGLRRLDFMLIPFVFWYIKTSYYVPSKLYSGYNQNFSIQNFFRSFLELCLDFTNLKIPALLFLFFFLVFKSIPIKIEASSKPQKHYYWFGIIATFCALFPYLIVGHPPTFAEWTSRHQLLLPLGISMLIWFLVKSISQISAKLLFASIISVCVAFSVSQYSSLIIDWKKQKELIRLMSKNDEIKKANLIVFEDLTQSLNAFNRAYRFYEWSGLLKMSFKDEKRLGINFTDINEVKGGSYLKLTKDAYNFRDFDQCQLKEAVVTIRFRPKLGLINRFMPILGDGRLYQIDVSPPHFFETTSK